MAAPEDQVLHLFSSNIRRLYEQDILDVIAAPPGLIRRFRFQPNYVDQRAQDFWGQFAKLRSRVLLNFSIQHPAAYQDPAFVPVRSGIVSRAYQAAGIYIVEFEVGDYIALPDPKIGRDGLVLLGDEVRRYGGYLDQVGIPRPYQAWASLGPDITIDAASGVEAAVAQDALSDRVVRYLQKTASFEGARFFRVLGVEDASGANVALQGGELSIVAGHTYQVQLAHRQPQEVEDSSLFKIEVDDEVLELPRRDSFEISSRYDTWEIPFTSNPAAVIRERRTYMTFEPDGKLQAAHVSIPIRVSPNKGQIGAGIAGAVAVVLAVALPTIFVGWSWGYKLAAVGVGGTITALLAVYGLKR